MAIPLVKILKNEWEEFERTSNSPDLKRKAVRDNIWKVMHCKTAWMGLAIYKCKDHPDIVKIIPLTCKSRVCPSCGYKANLVWLDQLTQRALPCDHQHLVFSLPHELRQLAKDNRREIFNLMSRCLSRTIMQFIRKHNSLDYVPGIVSILHTFGKSLKWHPHFHVLITAGGLKKGKWVKNSYINEKYLKKTFKTKMLKGLRKLYRQGKLINAIGSYPGQSFEQMLPGIYEKNWHAWIDEAREDSIFAFEYIGRYCKRACISQKGIIEYKKGKLVAWKERGKIETPDICANRADPKQFLELFIQHIPNTYDHQVRYYGLYASKNKKTLYSKACKIFKKKMLAEKEKSYLLSRFNKLMNLLHGVDPLSCTVCEKEMKLTGIVFFNPFNPSDKDILLNYEVKNYELAQKQIDSS